MLTFIEITDEPITPGFPYTNKKTNMPAVMAARQNAYVHQGDRYPLSMEVEVDEVAGPYRPGRYLLGGPCFEIKGVPGTGYTALGFNARKLHLIPEADAVAFLTGGAKPKAVAS